MKESPIYQLHIQNNLTTEPEFATHDEIYHQQAIKNTHTNALPTTTTVEVLFQATTTSRQQAGLENYILRIPTLQLQPTKSSTEQPTPTEPRNTYIEEIYRLPTTST